MKNIERIKEILYYWWQNMGAENCTPEEDIEFKNIVNNELEKVFITATMGQGSDIFLNMMRTGLLSEWFQKLQPNKVSKKDEEVITAIGAFFIEDIELRMARDFEEKQK